MMLRARKAVPVLVSLAGLTAGWAAFSELPAASAGASSPPPLGVYAGWGQSQTIGQLGAAIGQQPHYAMEFLNGNSWTTIVDSAAQDAQRWAQSGYSMIWGVDMLPGTYHPDSNPSDTTGSAYGLEQGATGAFDPYFAAVAKNLVAAGQGSSIIRLGWEFNGGWFPWAASGQQMAFVGFWRHIVDAMRSVAGQHFLFEWNPTRGDLGVGDLAGYYPGDQYVDIVGLDVYDTQWANYPGAQAEFSYMETEPYGLDWLANFAAQHGKPMSFPEWGLGWGASAPNSGPISKAGGMVCGGDDPTFINDMAHWIATHDVLEATFWDYGSSGVENGQNPSTMGALKSDFGPGGVASGSAQGSAGLPSTGGPAGGPPSTSPPPTTTTTAPDPPPTTTTTAPDPPPSSGGGQGPQITSPSRATYTAGYWGKFIVTTTGVGGVNGFQFNSSMAESGALPAGISFRFDQWSGTASLDGYVSSAAVGVYPITLSATNPYGTATQKLDMVVRSPFGQAAPPGKRARRQILRRHRLRRRRLERLRRHHHLP